MTKPDLEQWNHWAQCVIKVKEEFNPYLNMTDELYISYSSHIHTQTNPKGYYIFGIFEEISKVGSAMFRWIDFISGEEPQEQNTFPARSIIQAVLDEQVLWQRKLLEALVELVLYSQTNDEIYYKHYLLLREYRDIISTISDWKEFFGVPFNNYEWQKKHCKEKLKEVQKNIDLNLCWYLKKTFKFENNNPNIFESFRTKLINALALTTAREKIVFGITYKRYSDTSEGIHFKPERSIELPSVSEVERNMTALLLTILCIINRTQELIDAVPNGVNDEFNKLLNLPTDENKIISSLVDDRLDINDFVVTSYGELGIVVEKSISKTGYRIYKIKYLEYEPLPGITEEWFPGHYIKRIMSIKEHKSYLNSMEDEEVKSIANLVSEKEYLDALTKTFVEFWRLGMKQYFLEGDYNAFLKAFESKMQKHK